MGAAKKRSSSRPGATQAAAGRAETPIVAFVNAASWSEWLESHHARSRGVWLKIAKKGAKTSSVNYSEALDVALSWGWIDGQKRALDETWWLQKFTPRGARSVWSQLNCERALALVAADKMNASGLAEIERAKGDGRWKAAYASQSRATVPPDLALALESHPRAARFFETLESRNRYAVLFRVHAAKKPETRAKRIAHFVEMLERHEKIHP